MPAGMAPLSGTQTTGQEGHTLGTVPDEPVPLGGQPVPCASPRARAAGLFFAVAIPIVSSTTGTSAPRHQNREMYDHRCDSLRPERLP
jgi:hypothetical protein